MKRYFGILSFVVAVTIAAILISIKEEPHKEPASSSPIQVRFFDVVPQSVTDIVTGFGIVRARWTTTLSSEVDGRVKTVADNFLTGKKSNTGDVLVTIDPTKYKAAVAEAEAAAATAKRILQEEQNRVQIAKENWTSSGFEGAPSELVLRTPQLEEARTSVLAQLAALNHALYDLENTLIRAPYDGVVVDRNISPGDVLQVGDKIGTLYDRSTLEVVVPLKTSDIHRLNVGGAPSIISLVDLNTSERYPATLSRIEQTIDPINRLQNVILELSSSTNLIPEQFLRAELPGNNLEDVLLVPTLLRRKDGYIWYVDNSDLLQRFQPEVLFVTDAHVVVRAPENLVKPLKLVEGGDYFLPGTKVTLIPGNSTPLGAGDMKEPAR